jgi:hypothetical protein
MGRLLIPINCTWDEFISAQGTKYRAKIRRIERSLTQEGSWKTDYVDANRQSDAIKKIFEVEQNSWKDKWRTERGESTDESLMTVLSASQMLSNEPKFKLSICSLELDSKTIAYCTAIEYDDVAFIVKTSYDEHYKKLYPGIFIQHTTIQELFKNGRIKQIDFLSDLQYLRTWANDCIPRTRIMLAKGLLPTAMQSISETALVGKIRRKLF